MKQIIKNKIETINEALEDKNFVNKFPEVEEVLKSQRYLLQSILDEASKTKEQEQTYKIGDRFKNSIGQYMLVATEHNKIQLVNLEAGTFVADYPVKVTNVHNISSKEFKKLIAGFDFELFSQKIF